ncbi:MAG: hypothetical protein Q9M13_08385 [Mariprofundales bacterium]|nr:hypothetical protein [Mariprofundales bacterium]
MADAVTEQHRQQSREMQELIKAHEDRLHPDMVPDHHEQHKRYGGWLRRLDGFWDNVFKGVGAFVLITVGYGLLTIIKNWLGK